MSKFKDKLPLRQGMTIRYRERKGRYLTGTILNEWYTNGRTHLFRIKTDKGIFTISGHDLYPTAVIISMGRYTIYDAMRDRATFRKAG